MYHGLEEFNLTTTGGRVADVGLGGYALGGGVSNLSPKYGLAVDNILEYEIVLPNAAIVHVSEHWNSDLYFALRGGMTNFGIVTCFTMRAVPQTYILGGDKTYASIYKNQIANEAFELTTTWKNDTDMAFSYGYSYDQASDQFSLSFTHACARPILHPAPFTSLETIPFESSTVRIDRMSALSLEGASHTPSGSRNLFATITYHPSAQMDGRIMDIMAEESRPIKQVAGFFPNVIFQPLYEGVIRAGHERGGNALGIDADGPLTICLLTVKWINSQDDDAVNAFVQSWIERVKAATVQAESHYRWLYINYAYHQQDPFSGYGQHNKQRLVEVQKDIDQRGVFTSRGLCRGYFKLQ
ncbi:hypothetical protein N7520_001828 [Penicillium odoratum]|uniref:uncharacterized protein n=1 Tax=Penicillium odoratum TaxID=1167516 RepID=UPI0025474313|nr:uncharacterized protein N7520_001828 [Penicillium odoratum]KAJ5778582.1 hypothetical protein N7520_001828 [Penicillium odoratum]